MVNTHGQQVEFTFYRPKAKDVFVAGDFNDWRNGELAMTRDENGHWTADLRLPAGEYRFRYCADGEWFTDYAAFGVEPGRFGMDSVIWVEPDLAEVVEPAEIVESELVAGSVAA